MYGSEQTGQFVRSGSWKIFDAIFSVDMADEAGSDGFLSCQVARVSGLTYSATWDDDLIADHEY